MSKHTHRYHRVDLARKGNPPYFVMQCQDCSHYSPMKTKLSAPALLGRISICNKCSNKFELSRRALRMAKPVCDDCVEERETKETIAKAEDFFNELEKNLMGEVD